MLGAGGEAGLTGKSDSVALDGIQRIFIGKPLDQITGLYSGGYKKEDISFVFIFYLKVKKEVSLLLFDV